MIILSKWDFVMALEKKFTHGALAIGISLILFPVVALRAESTGGGAGIPVTVTKASRQDVPIWLHGLGTVQANYAVQLRPRVDGTLIKVPVKEGQQVKEGELLAVIDPRPYQAALDAAAAKKQQDEAQMANAQADLERYATLVRQDFASHQQLDTQRAMVKQFAASILGDDAQVEAAQLNLSFCYITSPFDGRIGLRNVDPGNVVHSAEAAPIISVTQIQPIAVTFTLPQDNLPEIVVAMDKHPLDVVVYASDNKTELDRGTLLTPDNTIDTTTGTIKLKAMFPNVRHTLWPGQFVNVGLLVGTDTNVISIPATSVQHGPNGLFVYQVGQNDVVEVQPIKVLRQEGDVYVVSQGVAEGAVIVATGQSRLQAGLRVVVHDPKEGSAASTRTGI